jgi:hypothetical protein
MGSAIKMDSSVQSAIGPAGFVQGNVQVAEMMTLQGQLSAAAVVAREIDPLPSSHAHGTTEDASGVAEAMPDQWAEATSGPPSTGASAVHRLVESGASLLGSSELFLVSVDSCSNSNTQCSNCGVTLVTIRTIHSRSNRFCSAL